MCRDLQIRRHVHHVPSLLRDHAAKHQQQLYAQQHQNNKHSPTMMQQPQHKSIRRPHADCPQHSPQRSIPQRLWQFVCDSVLVRPRCRMRAASYSPIETQPRATKRRARSCGHAPVQQPSEHALHRCSSTDDDDLCIFSLVSSTATHTNTATTSAWRKSKMLQELEAATEQQRHNCSAASISTPATPLATMRTRRQQRQRICCNCKRRFSVGSYSDNSGSAFCSLDCKSSFEYMATVQRLVQMDDNNNDYRQ